MPVKIRPSVGVIVMYTELFDVMCVVERNVNQSCWFMSVAYIDLFYRSGHDATMKFSLIKQLCN